MKIFSNLDKSQKIALLLVAALIINAIFHFLQPAYRYYREYSKNLDLRFNEYQTKNKQDYEDFVFEVNTNLVPLIIESYTNSVEMAMQLYQLKDKPINEQIIKDVVNKEEFKNEKTPEIIGDFWKVGNEKGITVGGYNYLIGDDFLGEPLIYISPNLIKTTNKTYEFKKRKDNAK